MPLQVNLLPREHRPKPAVRIWPVLLAIVFTINIVGMGSWWLFLQLDLAASLTELAIISNDVVQLDQQVQEAEAAAVLQTGVQVKRDYINNVIASSRCWHPFLDALEGAMVPGVSINNFSAAATGAVTLAGTSDSVESVTDFLGSLQVKTGLPVVRVSSIVPEGSFQIALEGWTGREIQEEPSDE